MKRLVKSIFQAFGHDVIKLGRSKISKPVVEVDVEILDDPAFQASVKEVSAITLLDTARLANLWQLSRLSNPAGALIEIGAYRGGVGIHVSNACPDRPIYVCDTFGGFGDLVIDPKADRLFKKEQYSDTSLESVKASWANKGRDVRWVRGYFPQSAAGMDISNISFAHVDTDLYESTRDTLNYLRPRLMDRSIVILDDYLRGADGLIRAVREFTQAHPDWAAFPMFPAQGLLLHRDWFE